MIGMIRARPQHTRQAAGPLLHVYIAVFQFYGEDEFCLLWHVQEIETLAVSVHAGSSS
jgi:hypothetical protein